jgi:hypothetical protein
MGTSTEVTPKLCAHERVEVKRFVNDARLWHPWLRINRVLRVMLQTRWSVEAWSQVRVEFKRALALRSEIRRAGWFKLIQSD